MTLAFCTWPSCSAAFLSAEGNASPSHAVYPDTTTQEKRLQQQQKKGFVWRTGVLYYLRTLAAQELAEQRRNGSPRNAGPPAAQRGGTRTPSTSAFHALAHQRSPRDPGQSAASQAEKEHSSSFWVSNKSQDHADPNAGKGKSEQRAGSFTSCHSLSERNCP